jgi:hypothetical protein
MTLSTRALTFLVAIAVPCAVLRAETPRLAGHWEGAIQIASGAIEVAVDLDADAAGTLFGTFTNPGERLTGYPLANVAVNGSSVRLDLAIGGDGKQTFDGTLSADGKSITGEFFVDVYAPPFELVRTGEARIAPPPRSPAVDRALAGTWTGSLNAGGASVAVALTLTNHDDGTATGAWSTGGGTAVPMAIAQSGKTLTLTTPVTPATFSGTASDDAKQISGTLKDDGTEYAVVFARGADAR